MQVDEVLADRMLVAHVLLCIVHVAQLRRDAAHRTRKRAHPREQVDVQLADVRHARAWVVVEAGREHMAVRATTPAVRLDARRRVAVPLCNLASLCAAEPRIVPPPRLIQATE